MRRRCLLAALLWVGPAAQAQSVLLEVPLMLQQPGRRGLLMAYTDADRFWVRPDELLRRLGYAVTADSLAVEAHDSRVALILDYRAETFTVNETPQSVDGELRPGPAGRFLITLDALQRVFGPDLEWDEAGLTVRVSTAATLFDPQPGSGRTRLHSEDPEDVRFGRRRQVLGGMVLRYDLSRQQIRSHGANYNVTADLTAKVLGGVARARLSRVNPQAVFTWDVRGTGALTRLEAGYVRADMRGASTALGVRISNFPLADPRVHRRRMLRGIAPPHAIVEAQISSITTDRTQADRAGRYALQIPVFYGSTDASVRVTPLGESGYLARSLDMVTPQPAIQPGKFRYDLSAGRTGAGVAAWGVTRQVTLRAGGGWRPARATGGATLLLLPTLYVHSEADLLERTGLARASWWRRWGEFRASYSLTRRPDPYTVIAGGGSTYFRGVSSRIHLSRAQYHNLPPVYTLTPTLGVRTRTGAELTAQGQWRGQGAGSLEQTGLLVTLSQLLQFRRRSLWLGALSRLDKAFRPDSWGGNLRYGAAPLHADIRVEKASMDDYVSVTASVQLNTDWVWLHTYGRMAGDYFTHRQGLRGAIGLGRTLTFSAMHQENTLVDLRIFTDTNLNGRRDAGEPVRYDVEVSVRNHASRRRRSGVVRTKDLQPYATYTVVIQPESIQDPTLQPATGYAFSFVAEPGGLRIIDVPLQPLLVVTGQVIGWPGAQEALEVMLNADGEEMTLPVYRDGGFFAQLRPGLYEVRLVNRNTGETVLGELHEVTPEAPSIILIHDGEQE